MDLRQTLSVGQLLCLALFSSSFATTATLPSPKLSALPSPQSSLLLAPQQTQHTQPNTPALAPQKTHSAEPHASAQTLMQQYYRLQDKHSNKAFAVLEHILVDHPNYTPASVELRHLHFDAFSAKQPKATPLPKNPISAAFFYNIKPPTQRFHAFNWVVVQPWSTIKPDAYNTTHTTVLSYVSIGEVQKTATYYKNIKPEWVIGRNKTWQADVVDESNPQWQQFFVDHVIGDLWKKGFRGFFLDTMDSFHLVAKTEAAKAKQIAGLVHIIKMIKAKYPDAKIIPNRGFELLPKIHDDVVAVAAESLLKSWDQNNQRYTNVSASNRRWLSNELNKVKNAYGLPAIVIDYVPPAQRRLAITTAKRIRALGFIPWVTDGHLDTTGVGYPTILPRKILVLYTYDTLKAGTTETLPEIDFISTPLNYLGYVSIVKNGRNPLPKLSPADYAGIVLVTGTEFQGTEQARLAAWLLKQKRAGIPLAFVSSLPFPLEGSTAKTFGFSLTPSNTPTLKVTITHTNPMFGFEAKPHPVLEMSNLHIARPTKLLLQIANQKNETADMAATTTWGGYALYPFVYSDFQEHKHWIINPFTFFRQALHLPAMPVPDITTENGRRLMIAHVDGDGFANLVEFNPKVISGREMEEAIFKRFRIPTTVSVIEGEISPEGVYPQYSTVSMETARDILHLPWVEPASHGFSHPFNWHAVEAGDRKEGYNLPIPGFKFTLQREILGSVDFVNKYLAPPNRPAKIFLWTGDTNPSAKAVGITYRNNLLNMNGGNTIITKSNNSLFDVSPNGVFKGPYFQVYAPIQNENVYTNNFSSPLYGYINVIQTFKMTDSPRRLKPIDIYYHFYSASKKAALTALIKVYQWALKQPVMNLYGSEYIKKALDFNDVTIEPIQYGWMIQTQGALREIRIPKTAGYPNLKTSVNVIGFSPYHNNYYVHLGPAPSAVLRLSNTAPHTPYLLNANAPVSLWQPNKDGSSIRLAFTGYRPLQFAFANMGNCSLQRNGKTLAAVIKNGVAHYELKETHSDALTLRCH